MLLQFCPLDLAMLYVPELDVRVPCPAHRFGHYPQFTLTIGGSGLSHHHGNARRQGRRHTLRPVPWFLSGIKACTIPLPRTYRSFRCCKLYIYSLWHSIKMLEFSSALFIPLRRPQEVKGPYDPRHPEGPLQRIKSLHNHTSNPISPALAHAIIHIDREMTR
ncbi:hypothetical protein BROC_00663 [Candidatus Brocadiaceae bacterium]|nr:hypothetical protein BROC_00663 [Candidatus Brocadiaceae bacterium]